MRIWDLSDTSCRMITIETPPTINNNNNSTVNQNQDAGVTSVSISPDGSMVAAGSLDSVIRIWEVASGILLDSLLGHRDSVYSVAFTPDGKGIISGSLDKSLRFWDLSSLLHRMATARNKDSPRKVTRSSSRPSSSVSTPVRDFIGHKVRRCFLSLPQFFFFTFALIMIIFAVRISYFPSQLRLILDGWYQDLKIVVCISGTRTLPLYNSFFKVIKILVRVVSLPTLPLGTHVRNSLYIQKLYPWIPTHSVEWWQLGVATAQLVYVRHGFSA